ncbi:MAG TPA: tyrosine--tRNA ligase [Candidatus Hydrogenedentes bacterium]|nr:tyrosine--tRNA ligase [Candidatus Hydrogenedentota bacterium]HOV74856.1 tyrosine--tRNA ligase [Candidatus Hydrogenedentota bacterium]
MAFFEELTWRGFVHQTTHEELSQILDRERVTLYCGFDPTADSLHIGSLLPIIGLARFQRAGHKPIALVGGGTGLIGDPSGKTQERQLLDKEQVAINLEGIRKQLERFLDFSGDNAAEMVNNGDWLCTLPLLDFLRDIGKHFSINVMLAKESVRQRVEDREHGMSFTEFSYSLLQAYDFLHLSDTRGCTLQIGGSDQWGNIVAGMDLIRRLRDKPAFGLTFPLVTKSDGAKFGKSESGNVWLDAARTSPYKFYQFWINQADSDVPRWLRYFTFMTPGEIAECEEQIAREPEKREAQRRLAGEVTRLVHGETALANAIRASQAMFGGELAGLDDATLEEVFSEVPSAEIPRGELDAGRMLVDVLVSCGVFSSKGEARRLIDNGGLYVNNARVDASDLKLTPQCLCGTRIAVIRKGKKNYHLLRFVSDR